MSVFANSQRRNGARRSALLSLALALIAVGLASPAAADAKLSYFVQSDGKAQWRLWSAADDRTELLVELPGVPALVFWESDARVADLLIKTDVYRLSLANRPASAEKVASLPTEFGALRALWRDKSTGRLRAIAMQRVAKAQIVTQGGKTSYRLKDGGKVAALADPNWGEPYICFVLELPPDGGPWKRIAARATKDEAGETPGDSVADDLRQEAGVSSERLLQSYTCKAGYCRNDVPEAFVQLAAAKAKRKLTGDDLSLWRVGRGLRSVLLGTVAGDQLHAVAPILVVGAEASAPALDLPLGRSGQYGLGVEDGRLLVAAELTGAHPIVVDLHSGRLLLDLAKGDLATWAPAGF